MNKIIVIGNLGRDPEMRFTPSGQAVTSFSLASNHSYTSQSGERRQETQWFNCSAWGKTAEICNQYLSKGQQVYVEGRVKTREFETRDGKPGFSVDIMVSQVHFLGKRDERSPARDDGDDSGYVPPLDDVDDLPF